MANYIATDTQFTATANAIRAKTGGSISIEWDASTGFADDIAAISGGGEVWAAISVTYPEGSTCTATNGMTTLTAADTSGKVLFGVPEPASTPEVWTISCSGGGDSASDTVSITEYGQYEEIELNYVQIYGVSWDGTSTTTWTRTDDAVGFTDPVPYVAGASSYGSPFDTISPWKDMIRVTDAQAGEMVKIPKFWYKLSQNGSGMSIQISNGPQDGFSVCPACMDRGDGNGERDYILVGRYHCASTYKSTTGVKPVASKTRSAFRTSIKNLGTGIYQWDWATRFTIWLLYLVEFADWNSQTKIGYGCGNNSATENMGYTDSMPYHTGTTKSSRTTYGLGTQYRYIEGLWDNVLDWIDGCYYSSSGLNIIKNPSSFSDGSGGTAIVIPSNGYPTKFTVKDISGTFPMFVATTASGSNTTYSCDSWGYYSSYPCLFGGGVYSQDLNRGLFYVYYSSASYSNAYIGSRSMKLP